MDALFPDAEQLDELVPRELGDRDDGRERAGHTLEHVCSVEAAPPVERGGNAQHGEVVEGRDERHRRMHRRVKRRAVEHVDGLPTGQERQCRRVPADVTYRGGQAAAAPERELAQRDPSDGRQRLQEAVDVARGARARKGERGDVEADRQRGRRDG